MIATLLAVASMSSAPMTTIVDEAPNFQSTRAGEIAARFEQSQASRRESVEGWYSGRCYYMNQPDLAVGNLLVTETRTGHGGGGPIFDRPITKFLVVGVGNYGAQGSPDYFDNMSPSTRQGVQSFVDQVMVDPNLVESYYSDASLSSEFAPSNIHWDMRSDREFHYIRGMRVDTRIDTAYCYFFKKVK